ncbi:MAG: hypothetical protein ABIF87_18245 [Pseudomonadota bacterium]
MMRYLCAALGVVFLVCLSFGFAFSQEIMVNAQGEVIQRTDKGSVNWTTREICATGYSDPNQSYYAKRSAAEVVARANLLSVLEKVYITSERTVGMGLMVEDIRKEQVAGILAHSYLLDPVTRPDGVMEVKACKTIGSDLNELLQPYAEKDTGKKFEPAEVVVEKPVAPVSEKYTGLIIDARGKGAKPAMSPKVLVEDSDQVVYGIGQVDRNFAIQSGLTGYAGTVDKAKNNDRVGNNPLIVKVKRVQGKNKVDFVISKEDAVKIYQSDIRQGKDSFLKQCRVVIVVG